MRIHALILVVVMMFTCLGCPEMTKSVDIPGITGPKVSDKEQVIAVLDDVHRGMESRRVFKVLAHVSKNYHDQEGRDYAAIQAYLSHLFKEYCDIEITRTRPRVVTQGTRARAIETFGTRARPTNPLNKRDINLQGQVTVHLEKTGDVWQIVEWGPVL